MDMDYDFQQQWGIPPPPPPTVPTEIIDDLHTTIIRTRRTLQDCDNQLNQLQSTLKSYLAHGDDTGLGGAMELTHGVLREWFGTVAEFMPLVAQVEDKEDRLMKLLEATREVVGCLLATLRWAGRGGGRAGGRGGRGNVCIV
ncbi:uncharacterized protein LAJ45_10718 [Morchella importuna]|uniref:uncharacterized protein n=1 Tax=Morchella importuna TaxID=1174673 RepID=UPI001E8DA740|nr:uncharacterized protein LAJ45_10718 [Morchella importuna]KAH8145281.1 hypothetical protein LAJ45_10718 [Morchella importuna]